MIAVVSYLPLRRERAAARRVEALKRKFAVRVVILVILIALHFV